MRPQPIADPIITPTRIREPNKRKRKLEEDFESDDGDDERDTVVSSSKPADTTATAVAVKKKRCRPPRNNAGTVTTAPAPIVVYSVDVTDQEMLLPINKGFVLSAAKRKQIEDNPPKPVPAPDPVPPMAITSAVKTSSFIESSPKFVII